MRQLYGKRKMFSMLPFPFSARQYSFCFLLIPGVTAPFGALLPLESAKPHRKGCGFLDFCGFFIALVP